MIVLPTAARSKLFTPCAVLIEPLDRQELPRDGARPRPLPPPPLYHEFAHVYDFGQAARPVGIFLFHPLVGEGHPIKPVDVAFEHLDKPLGGSA